MASYQRIALYIFFDAIERDLVRHIRSISGQLDDKFLGKHEREKAIGRSKNNDSGYEDEVNDFELLHLLDLGDKIAIIQRFNEKLDDTLRKHLASKRQALQDSIPIRNALMHGRPLTVSEHAISFALANDLVRKKAYWPNLERQLTDYNKDPDSVTRKAVSFLEDVGDISIFHNLPPPDYDDTGFVPRPKLEQELRRKILGRHPVVTVLGDGGNGKTALALQSLYGLVNSGDHDFDAVVWVSAKSSKLTVGEIQRIEHAIISSLGLFDHIAGIFDDTGGDSLGKVRQLLESNRILLVIDNLETVLDASIREFASDVPGESKIVFTSRIPVGGDLTVTVGPLADSESETYLRALVKAYSISSLEKKPSDELRSFANRLGNKPLLLKWFCLGVAAGLAPKSILANPKVALKFCLENVFDALRDEAREAISIMSVLPRAVSLGVLQHVSASETKVLESGLSELLKFTLVEVENADGLEVNYKIKPFARAYISRVLSITPKNRDKIIDSFKGLSSIYQNEKGAEGTERYNARNYTVRSISEALTVQKLRSAVRLATSSDPQDALDILEEAKISHPDYFEVYRTEAFLKFRQHDPVGANDAYEAAIDLAPDMPQLHFFYGGFLLRSFNDCKGAIEKLVEALRLDPSSAEVKRELARAKMLDLDFVGAEKILSIELDAYFANLRPKLILSDLRLQNFHRMISHFAATGINADLKAPIKGLTEFLRSIDPAVVDDTMLNHLKKTHSDLSPVVLRLDSSENVLGELEALINNVSARILVGEDGPNSALVGLIGSLKEQGRKPNFGFLVEASGRETFLLRSSISDLAWRDLISGSTARYDIELDEQGRGRAVNVSIASFPPREQVG